MTTSPAIDWEEVTREAIDLLSRYIAIDTSNPPGREQAAADFLSAVLRENGIECEVFPLPDGRANLAARLPGSGRKPPFVLLSHMDVVPVQREFWQEDPFGGVVRDGFVWGRGAVDMKGMGVMELMTLLLLRRLGLPLSRDVLFVAAADEEAGGEAGIEWLDANHPELFDVEYVINEGGYGSKEMFGVKRPVFSCSVGEKGPLWLRLVSEGAPGHGSVPHRDNCVERLVRALHRIQEWEREPELLPALRPMFDLLQEAGMIKGDLSNETLRELAANIPLLKALLTDTISTTMVNAGVKANVIPARAEAVLDCRLLPGHEPDAFIEQLTAVIADPKIRIEKILESQTPISPVDTELFETIREVAKQQAPEALLLPSIASGFTDSRAYRRRGVVAYGFIPALLTMSELASAHGHNERISIENLRLGTQILFEVVRRMCA
ncbi:MAG: M20/M25/M40 family metallo-hydrolase [Dehalococcoidia bacterium]|nr:M20/M25/M40 family metallo-hydrolase [Dehalococcoidia bacterium]